MPYFMHTKISIIFFTANKTIGSLSPQNHFCRQRFCPFGLAMASKLFALLSYLKALNKIKKKLAHQYFMKSMATRKRLFAARKICIT